VLFLILNYVYIYFESLTVFARGFSVLFRPTSCISYSFVSTWSCSWVLRWEFDYLLGR